MMKIFSKMINTTIILSMIFSYFIPVNIYADNYEIGIVTESAVRFRSQPSTSSSTTIISELNTGTRVIILGTVNSGSGCSKVWYHVELNDKEGYICGEYIKVKQIPKENINNSFEEQLSKFPESYHSYLRELHRKYPTWNFQPLNTNIDFNSAVNAQSVVGKSLIQGPEGYRSTAGGSYNYLTDKFVVLEGSNWYAANEQVVAYYLDPRNFLNESNIFMFEDLTFNSQIHTLQAVKKVLKSDYLMQFADIFLEAATTHNISPIHLAARVRQEVGLNGSPATSGEKFTYNGVEYSGLYNFFNIGATTSSNPVYKGLIYANGGEAGSDLQTSYGRPWNTPAKAIMGGAQFLAQDYINKGQYTLYLQKFNVNPNSTSPLHSHQYMTNVRAPYSESSSVAESYVSLDLEDEPYVFTIPVFKNMPNNTTLPHTGNPNNYLKKLTINGLDVPGFDNNKLNYTIEVSKLTKNIVISATSINNKATISGLGEIILEQDELIKVITVKAENGATRIFNIKFVRSESVPISIDEIINNIGIKYNGDYINGLQEGTNTSVINDTIKQVNPLVNTVVKDINGNIKNNATFATGDKVIIKTDSESKTYTVIIRGDTNSDGKVNVVDLLRIQKHILGTKLVNEQGEAADVNGDGKVTVLDLLLVQKYLLKATTLV